MHSLRAVILENLGRTEEATAAKNFATSKPTFYQPTIYSEFQEKLKKLRLKTGDQ